MKKNQRYTVGKTDGYKTIWIYDSKKTKCGQAYGNIIIFPMLGDGNACLASYKEQLRLANKICGFLNK